ncbi:MAG: undecaprenyldiphospho-muramoylpentapeptide beta-N-acetylglucosaminyltransferase [Candidatus Pacebacteria bacterium]|nr:undecaprenyldiphospho-muramoylpentapeptide beta-N-acetylglucosaminyltransferase [Candidatus Paceibacterota bacterium]MDR3583493.1 undecaprenyldiphospho-muramoylpentapeptide beta-N-acetylglucosaminyltransferase [Candidatus Paceibacterota bacterium]
MRIVLTGGGTGGHIVPLVAVAEKIKEKAPDCEFIFVGPKGDLEKKLMDAQGIPTKGVMAGKMRRYFSFWHFVDIFKIPIGIIQALWHLLWLMPDAIFSKGGYASFPVVFVGWLYRIPIMIHESDANPGLANSVLAKFSERVAVSYSQAEIYFPASQVVLTGSPLRSDIAAGDAVRAREMFHFTDSKKVIFVVGGSLGARSINNKIIEILPELLRKYQVIHQTGQNNIEEVKQRAGEQGIKAEHGGYFPLAFYGDEIKDILAMADLVISRAGASTISEIAANRKPSILIPLETAANNHQRMNAYAIAKTGGCVVLEENNMGHNMLIEKIEEIMNDDKLREKLSQNIKAFYHPDAAEKIAEGILGMIK